MAAAQRSYEIILLQSFGCSKSSSLLQELRLTQELRLVQELRLKDLCDLVSYGLLRELWLTVSLILP